MEERRKVGGICEGPVDMRRRVPFIVLRIALIPFSLAVARNGRVKYVQRGGPSRIDAASRESAAPRFLMRVDISSSLS